MNIELPNLTAPRTEVLDPWCEKSHTDMLAPRWTPTTDILLPILTADLTDMLLPRKMKSSVETDEPILI
jgi:hypothetical protein